MGCCRRWQQENMAVPYPFCNAQFYNILFLIMLQQQCSIVAVYVVIVGGLDVQDRQTKPNWGQNSGKMVNGLGRIGDYKANLWILKQ